MTSFRRFLLGFRFAGFGIARTLRTELNMRVHVSAAIAVTLFNLVVRPSDWLVVADLGAVAAVIAAELVNTALEALADEVSGGMFSMGVKIAKDAAAGAVLAVACGAVAVGIAVVVAAYPWRWRLGSTAHPLGAWLSLGALALLVWVVAAALRMREERGRRDDGQANDN